MMVVESESESFYKDIQNNNSYLNANRVSDSDSSEDGKNVNHWMSNDEFTESEPVSRTRTLLQGGLKGIVSSMQHMT